jgi:antitoxin ParD1/3/4
MTILLSRELEQLILEKVKSGQYPSAEALVSAALARLLQDEEDFAPGELEELLKVGIEQLDRGEGLDGAKVFDELRRKSASVRAGRNP